MEQNPILNLNSYELEIVRQINLVFQYSYPESDLLEYTLISVKIQGSAYLQDVMSISSLGVPIFAIIASKRKVTVSEIVKHLQDGSIHFYEFKNALMDYIYS